MGSIFYFFKEELSSTSLFENHLKYTRWCSTSQIKANPSYQEMPLHTHWNGSHKQTESKNGKDVEKVEPLYVIGKTVKWQRLCKRSLASVRHRSFTPRNTLKNSKQIFKQMPGICLKKHKASNTIHYRWNVQTTKTSITDEWGKCTKCFYFILCVSFLKNWIAVDIQYYIN